MPRNQLVNRGQRPVNGIAIVSPGYPDTPGGVTDHTARLVRHWSQAGPVRVHAAGTGNPGAIVEQWRRDGVGAVLLQYVPFLYAKRGLSTFPEAIARAARAAGIRVTVFVHEPWVPLTRLPWLVLSPLQRRQLRRLVGVADAIVTAVPAWQAMLGGPTELLPVGSTLGDPPPPALEPALPGPVVFSPFAAGLHWRWILAAVRGINAAPPLVVIGATHDQAVRRMDSGAANPSWDWRGRVSGADALALLSRASVVLAPFVDGMTARRTSALAALSVGARVVTSSGPLFDAAFHGGPAVARSETEFVNLAVSAWQTTDQLEARAQRREWYRARFDDAQLDDKLRRVVLPA